MIYNFNLGIGWASSGVEYAQSYRANLLRSIGAPAKFIFTEMFPQENIEHMTRNIGFLDSEIIWMYTYFTDTRISPVTYTLNDLVKTFDGRPYSYTRDGKVGRCKFNEQGDFYTVYFTDETSELVHRVEIVSKGCLIRKDYFTYLRIYSEYYAPLDNAAHLYQRRYFNEDGSVAYEEIIDDGQVMYRFPDGIPCTNEEFVGYFVKKLNLTSEDVVIIDRTTGIGQAILENAGSAKVGIVIHADHFSEGSTDDETILWNNYYEYPFAQHERINFYITATDAQNKLVVEQFEKYMGVTPKVFTIPVGSLDNLHYPFKEGRKPYSMITASRLATEKHIDWLVKAAVKAKKEVPELTLDIYGKGGEEDKIRELINENDASGYITLMGQHDLAEVYQKYEVYAAASTSEGFGLTLLEAVGGGLPIFGFDVRYGNPTFIDDGENGYLIPIDDKMDDKVKIELLYEKMVEIFTKADLKAFHEHSYKKASGFLTSEVEKKWAELLITI